MDKPLITVVETSIFLRRAEGLLSVLQRAEVVNFVSANPEAGDLIQGTGGLRKLRWAAKGKGKSGGVRVIYFFHNDRMPVFLLTVYGKNRKADLSAAERAEFKKLTEILVKEYDRDQLRGRRHPRGS